MTSIYAEGPRVPINTTINLEAKQELEKLGITVSSALALGIQEILKKAETGKTSAEQVEKLAASINKMGAENAQLKEQLDKVNGSVKFQQTLINEKVLKDVL